MGCMSVTGCHFQKQVEAGVCVTMEMVQDALDQLRGAVMIVYPMGLPPYDPIRMEFENKEDLSGTQVCGPPPASSPRAGPSLTLLFRGQLLPRGEF